MLQLPKFGRVVNPAILVLEDGSVFHGTGIGIDGFAVGEVVFNTAMTGYQEILTDPSYAKQIITFTYPHVGNTGTNRWDVESSSVWAEALVIRDLPLQISNWRSEVSLGKYLRQENVVGIADVDTRRLTRILRAKGALSGCVISGISASEEGALEKAKMFPGLSGMDLAKVVTRKDWLQWKEGSWGFTTGYTSELTSKYHVFAYDFGVKHNILRLLTDRGCLVTLVPATTSADAVLKQNPDGVFLSNGPGDPGPCHYAISAIQRFVERKVPTFGICLGHQLLALASGAKTIKMRHGHHGANHPVKEILTGRVVITSQNHGFAVDGDSLPPCLEITHISLFDGSLQGISRTDAPAFGFQGHPEASPGPQDCLYMFDHFCHLMDLYQLAQVHA